MARFGQSSISKQGVGNEILDLFPLEGKEVTVIGLRQWPRSDRPGNSSTVYVSDGGGISQHWIDDTIHMVLTEAFEELNTNRLEGVVFVRSEEYGKNGKLYSRWSVSASSDDADDTPDDKVDNTAGSPLVGEGMDSMPF